MDPLPPPRRHEADAAGKLLPNPTGRPSPLATPSYARNSAFNATHAASPDARAFIASLRSAASPPQAQKWTSVTPDTSVTKKTLPDREREEKDRARKLWSTSIHEKNNMADALDATMEELKDCICQQRSLLTTKNLNAVESALKRITPLKKKLEGLTAKDTSPTTQIYRTQARNENIRARNLLDSLISQKFRLAKQLRSASLRPGVVMLDAAAKPILPRPEIPQKPLGAQLPELPQWALRLYMPPDRKTANDHGYDSAESISPEFVSPLAQIPGQTMSILKSPSGRQKWGPCQPLFPETRTDKAPAPANNPIQRLMKPAPNGGRSRVHWLVDFTEKF